MYGMRFCSNVSKKYGVTKVSPTLSFHIKEIFSVCLLERLWDIEKPGKINPLFI